MVYGKNILLCVTGGIAAYKAAALTSQLTQRGANVKVIMSEGACQFITPLTFQALSRNEVYVDTFAEKNPAVIAHIDLADWADLVLVAPATANTIGKLANGIADNMITTTLLATKAPVWIAPAMNVHMYEHPAVQANIETLYRFGYRFIEPSEGYLACGYVGKGRLEEPEKIIKNIENYFSSANPLLKGKKVLVTAGPTREKLDPVRFFSNRSTGKMGYAIAEAAARFGAEVTLISGPTELEAPANVKTIRVESAQDMYEAVMERFPDVDIVIKSAAVADYRPKHVFAKKIKKQPGDYIVEMERTIDILKTLGERKTSQILVGFAAETDHVEEYARQKLESKRLDMVVANNVTQEGAGFAGDTNVVTIFKRDGSVRSLPLMSKKQVAEEILKEIHQYIEAIR
ncbi:bifunctional phosphopantothenoylcysteine decarboxylase/phosphopantothenate--cysteine ligase CoaBC [Saccharococcus caldoxylosilyticus]|jgi:phosphopantothenoylcysteine decarboxylase / phosphopantothenate---cysteine ligase|uniref:Coenzyme A biosynthesis bifunctional protein CoaBC n=1 Tax=Saccharococcus caldoxylosilyticus TaxID=81408 RepID=A0A150L699_9BACL|nr:bifunctional phosphopantothenoylcysteine decarboxylase/phosphopantothenate--cysteine ligase CoaBC [Parageobacillus caldoxylosilyticus]KYD07212.1 Phosphopantothenoylcysteine decarboxylase [Parageobacillus caldoxylosilyticus]BDG35089.1 phosphopantothenoylcysteine decarboxylase [Parageobacillus caldoxylosilyticus]BDG38864.1 phosphopantothenoylcysteine decarboxylase [Parageobacillus caldoxylosilyticus]BDG42664.1 phosphopantothenoylcysteine decarboxylase [Parageobacillus caldoxylosilyticus]